jgi:hypothetical protein
VASLLAGLALSEPESFAGDGPGNAVEDDNGNVTSFTDGTTPAQAYGLGYNQGFLGSEAYANTGNQALDDAFNNGNIDGLEGLDASPPGCATCGLCATCAACGA